MRTKKVSQIILNKDTADKTYFSGMTGLWTVLLIKDRIDIGV